MSDANNELEFDKEDEVAHGVPSFVPGDNEEVPDDLRDFIEDSEDAPAKHYRYLDETQDDIYEADGTGKRGKRGKKEDDAVPQLSDAKLQEYVQHFTKNVKPTLVAAVQGLGTISLDRKKNPNKNTYFAASDECGENLQDLCDCIESDETRQTWKQLYDWNLFQNELSVLISTFATTVDPLTLKAGLLFFVDMKIFFANVRL